MDEELLSTGDVLEDAGDDVSEAQAREWANANGVTKIGNVFVWRESERDYFFDYLDDRAEEEEIDEEEDEEYEDDED